MSSENKKRKAKNSFIHNGGEKNTIEKWKDKRICYFTKADRNNLKKKTRKELEKWVNN